MREGESGGSETSAATTTSESGDRDVSMGQDSKPPPPHRRTGIGTSPPRSTPEWSICSGAYHFCRFALSSGAGGTGSEETATLLATAGSVTSAVDVCRVPGDDVGCVPGTLRVNKHEDDDEDEEEKTVLGCTPSRINTLVAPADYVAAVAGGGGDGHGNDDDNSGDGPGDGPTKLGTVMALCFVPSTSPDRTPLLLAAYEEGTIALWDPSPSSASTGGGGDDDDSTGYTMGKQYGGGPRPPLWRSREHGEAALCLAVDVKGRGAISGGADGRVVQYSIAVSETSAVSEPPPPPPPPPSSSQTTIDATNTTPPCVPVRADIKVNVTRVRAHGPYAPAAAAGGGGTGWNQPKQAGVADVAIRHDRKIFAAACWDGRVRVYEYKGKNKGRPLASLAYHSDVVTSIAFDCRFFLGDFNGTSSIDISDSDSNRRGGGGGGGGKIVGTGGRGGGGGGGYGGYLLASSSRDGTVALWPIFPPTSAKPR